MALAAGNLILPPALAVPASLRRTQASSGQASATRKKKSKAAQSRHPLTPEPARIREIQQALAKEGYYHEEPSGKWDDASTEAMKQFQTAKGLPPTGKLEALSLQKLGLGSPVAGVAAPASPAPHPSFSPPANPPKPPR